MKTKADLQMRLAEIKIRGYIKSWDDYILLYMIMTGQIEMPEGALFEQKDGMGNNLRSGRGLFNPLKKIETVDRDKLKRFSQHFPMLFNGTKGPNGGFFGRGKDWLYNDTPGDPSDWMKLIKDGPSTGEKYQ